MSETRFNDCILMNIIYISSAPSNRDNLANNKFPAFFMPLNVGCVDIIIIINIIIQNNHEDLDRNSIPLMHFEQFYKELIS